MAIQILLREIYLGNAGGWYYVARQSDRLQVVVNLGQVIRTLVEIVFVEALSDRRPRLSVANRDPSFSVSWIGRRLDVGACTSRVAGVAIRSRSTQSCTRACSWFARDFFPKTTSRSLLRC